MTSFLTLVLDDVPIMITTVISSFGWSSDPHSLQVILVSVLRFLVIFEISI